MKSGKKRLRLNVHQPPPAAGHQKPAAARSKKLRNLGLIIAGCAFVVVGTLLPVWLTQFDPKPVRRARADSKPPAAQLAGAVPAKPAASPVTSQRLPPLPTNLPSSTTHSPAEVVANVIQEANQRLQKNEVDAAIRLYEQTLKLHSEDEDLHYNLGIAYARKGNADKAIEHYTEALRIVPDYAEVHNNLGNLLVNQRKYEEGDKHFIAALKVTPDYASAHNNFGTSLRMQGKVDEAIKHYAEAARLTPNYVEAHFNLGNAYLNRGRVMEATAEFNEVIRLRPDFEATVQQAITKGREQPLPGAE